MHKHTHIKTLLASLLFFTLSHAAFSDDDGGDGAKSKQTVERVTLHSVLVRGNYNPAPALGGFRTANFSNTVVELPDYVKSDEKTGGRGGQEIAGPSESWTGTTKLILNPENVAAHIRVTKNVMMQQTNWIVRVYFTKADQTLPKNHLQAAPFLAKGGVTHSKNLNQERMPLHAQGPEFVSSVIDKASFSPSISIHFIANTAKQP